MTKDDALKLLRAAGVFFYDDPVELFDDSDPAMLQTINLSDTWAWASADGEYVPDAELPEVARLFKRYGLCGLLYWVSERNNQQRSEFHDVNRQIEFVRHEERIRREIPDSSQRAYSRQTYTIGGEP